MSEWKEYVLSDVIEIIGGGTPKTSVSEYWGGSIPWLSVVDFGNDLKYVEKTEKNITELGLKNSSTKILSTGQIVISARGTVGELAMIRGNMAFNQSCYGLNAKESLCNNDFLYYLLKCKIVELKRNAHGAVFDTITRTTFDTISVKLPPLPTQNAIAEILSSLDEKIELNNKINQELETLAQTLFKQWFIDFEFPNENGEPYKSSGGEMVESELGEIPKGWAVYSMNDLLETISKTYPLKKVKEVVFLNTGDIQDGKFLHKNLSNPENLPGQAKKSISENDILYSEIRPANKRFAYVYFNSSQYVVSTKLMVMRSKVEINSLFQYFYLTQKEVIQYLQQLAESRSGTFPQITFSEVSTIKIALPHFDLVNTFVEIALKPYYNNLFCIEEENESLTKLRDTLLPKLISGELEINEIAN